MGMPYLSSDVQGWIERLTVHLDARLAWRLLPLLTGFLFATGRRTVSTWLRAGALSDDYQDYYYFLSSLGHKVKALTAVLVEIAAEVIAPSGRLLLAIDDTPSQRYGPKVEGAGIHHNPTPGPAGAKFLYGHNWVTLTSVVRHPRWGAIGLPLLARLDVRRKDLDAQCLTLLRRVTFQTKLVMAAELVQWAATWLHPLRRAVGRSGWRLRQAALLEGNRGRGGDHRQPPAQGRGLVRGAGGAAGGKNLKPRPALGRCRGKSTAYGAACSGSLLESKQITESAARFYSRKKSAFRQTLAKLRHNTVISREVRHCGGFVTTS